jgi:predicted site-specific integrase-resolvase
MNGPADLLATRDVCRMVDRSEATVRLWVRSGKLRTIRLPSGQNLFQRADVLRLLKKQRETEQEPPPAVRGDR